MSLESVTDRRPGQEEEVYLEGRRRSPTDGTGERTE